MTPTATNGPTTRLRPVMIGGLVLVIALVGLFAYFLAHSQSQARHDTQKRFRDVATVSAALVDSIFSLSGQQSGGQASTQFGGPQINARKLNAVAARGQSPYVEIYDSHGHRIGATAKAPARSAPPAAVTRALRTRQPVLSDFTRAHIAEFAIPFQSKSGTRVQLQAISPPALALFLTGFLKKVPNFAKARSAVVDGNGVILGGPGLESSVGKPFPDMKVVHELQTSAHGDYDGSYFAAAPISHSAWHVVLTAKRSKLYASVNGSRRTVPWAIFAAFVVMAIAGLFLLRRSMRANAELAAKEISEEHAVQINDNVIQGLALAKYKLEAGQQAESSEQLAQTLGEAQRLVSDLLGEAEVEPGQLRREEAASTERTEPAPEGGTNA